MQNLHKHSNADRLQCCTVFGCNVIVDLSYHEGQKVVYFPTGGQLSEKFCKDNNLVRCKDENGKNIGGYLDPVKRNITAIKLRGECSDGLVLPIECLKNYTKIETLKVGDSFSELNGELICCKYVPIRRGRKVSANNSNPKKKKIAVPIAPLFTEHVDTAQLAYNYQQFHCGDFIEITLKMDGTSGRTGYLPVLDHTKKTFLDHLLKRPGKPVYNYDYISGTRRTLLDGYDGGYYGNDEFRKPHAELFRGKLHKGETVYYEIVGYTDNGTPIMPSVSNKKTNDKGFIKKYGTVTEFSYGCDPDSDKKSECYVYRMTMTNDDGYIVEYPPYLMRIRCEQMGVKTVPVLWKGVIPYNLDPQEFIQKMAETYYDGADPIGKTHIREGVVCRILNRESFSAYKHKNFSYKMLRGITSVTITDEQLANMSDDMIDEL